MPALKKWFPRIAIVCVVGFVALWLLWPQISKVTMLVPVEKELHSYQKKAQPLEQTLVQRYRELEKEPDNRDHVEAIVEKSADLQALNEKYWVEGMGPSFLYAFMYRIRGMEAPPAYLPEWLGADDREGMAALVGMRPDTATLLVKSWEMKQSANALAREILATFGDGAAVTQESLASTAPAIAEAGKSRADADFVYKRWKGSYRPPFSFLR